jgi:hypothetical protein
MTTTGRPHLDGLLATWAQARRLPDADAERIRQAIVPAVAAPSMTWWSEFNDKISTAIGRATSMPIPGLAGVQ